MNEELSWIDRARKGDPDAFEKLVLTYEKAVYRLTLRLCGNPEDAAEAAQEAFLSVWRSLPFFRGDAKFSTWLYRLATNAAIDLLRREKKHTGTLSLDDEVLNPDVADHVRYQPQSQLERAELRDAIERSLAALSPEYRQILLLREMQQLSYEEIGAELNLEPGTVKSRISRARRQLRLILLESGNFFDTDPSNSTKGGSR